jgi:hypothetical protein
MRLLRKRRSFTSIHTIENQTWEDGLVCPTPECVLAGIECRLLGGIILVGRFSRN